MDNNDTLIDSKTTWSAYTCPCFWVLAMTRRGTITAKSKALAVILSEAKDLSVKNRFFAKEAQND